MRLTKYELDSVVAMVKDHMVEVRNAREEEVKKQFFRKNGAVITKSVSIVNAALKTIKNIPAPILDQIDYKGLEGTNKKDLSEEVWNRSKEKNEVRETIPSNQEIQNKCVQLSSRCTDLNDVFNSAKVFYGKMK